MCTNNATREKLYNSLRPQFSFESDFTAPSWLLDNELYHFYIFQQQNFLSNYKLAATDSGYSSFVVW